MDDKRKLLQDIFFEIQTVVNRHAAPQWHYEEQSLPYYNIMLIYDGEGEFIRNGERHTVRRGDFIFYRLGDSRSISTDRNNILKCYGINFRYIVPVFQDKEPFNDCTFDHIDLPIDFVTRINNEHTLDRLLYLFDRLFRIYLSNTILS
ncbi:MAG: AraC family ligand binding domain-containing protein, partial [Clostridia bacterium]|nr:AraC family ligand binding domain-containing protein [Clostridia bacterium]